MSAIRIIRPSSLERPEQLSAKISMLAGLGRDIRHKEIPFDDTWPFTAGSIKDRLDSLVSALKEPGTETILCARGGYGASDLLPLIPWSSLQNTPHKWIVGFSDACALLSAFYTKLKWPSIHGPMPASHFWQDQNQVDVKSLFEILSTSRKQGVLHLTPINTQEDRSIHGTLFGGCFSVLTNLIGTPYFPKSLKDHILFFEDVSENPGRLSRFLNQFLQSGALDGVRAIIWGELKGTSDTFPQSAVKAELSKRVSIPCFSTADFGHLSPNMPIVIGSQGHITDSCLVWRHADRQ